MKLKRLHPWPRKPAAALALQRRLAGLVRLRPVSGQVRLLAGADAAFSPDGRRVIGGVVVWDLKTGALLEQRVACRACRFPYVPGLLSFREAPALLAAFGRLRTEPQVVLCDAHGLAHPRRIGLACHLGLWLERPTLGCAKSRLCGQHTLPAPARGCRRRLLLDGQQVGLVLRTQDRLKPIYVSPGHLCDHASAARLTLAAATRFRLPEPTRLAHQLVTRLRDRC